MWAYLPEGSASFFCFFYLITVAVRAVGVAVRVRIAVTVRILAAREELAVGVAVLGRFLHLLEDQSDEFVLLET